MQHGFLAVTASVTKAEVRVLTTRCRVNQYKVFLRAKLFYLVLSPCKLQMGKAVPIYGTACPLSFAPGYGLGL